MAAEGCQLCVSYHQVYQFREHIALEFIQLSVVDLQVLELAKTIVGEIQDIHVGCINHALRMRKLASNGAVLLRKETLPWTSTRMFHSLEKVLCVIYQFWLDSSSYTNSLIDIVFETS